MILCINCDLFPVFSQWISKYPHVPHITTLLIVENKDRSRDNKRTLYSLVSYSDEMVFYWWWKALTKRVHAGDAYYHKSDRCKMLAVERATCYNGYVLVQRAIVSRRGWILADGRLITMFIQFPQLYDKKNEKKVIFNLNTCVCDQAYFRVLLRKIALLMN